MLTHSFDKLYRVILTIPFRLAHVLERNLYYQIRRIKLQGTDIRSDAGREFPHKVFKDLAEFVNVGLWGCWMANEMDDGFAPRAD
jgi:hypothetical protein